MLEHIFLKRKHGIKQITNTQFWSLEDSVYELVIQKGLEFLGKSITEITFQEYSFFHKTLSDLLIN